MRSPPRPAEAGRGGRARQLVEPSRAAARRRSAGLKQLRKPCARCCSARDKRRSGRAAHKARSRASRPRPVPRTRRVWLCAGGGRAWGACLVAAHPALLWRGAARRALGTVAAGARPDAGAPTSGTRRARSGCFFPCIPAKTLERRTATRSRRDGHRCLDAPARKLQPRATLSRAACHSTAAQLRCLGEG